MKNTLTLLFCLLFIKAVAEEENPATLSIGSKAPDFNLKGVDGKMYSLKSFASAKVLVIVFTCNHCPTAQAYEDRILAIDKKYKSKGVSLVAISPNSDKAVRFDELGYSDLSDSYLDMKIRAKDKKFSFPYLYDGGSQSTAKAYGPTTTPHTFVFDKNRKLQYVGRIDDDEHLGRQKTADLDEAIAATLENKTIEKPVTKTFGCSIKWASKAAWKDREMEDWKKEQVKVEKIDISQLKKILGPNSEKKYKLVNFWATWCGPCLAEMSSLIETDKMYRNRDFEFITVSMDAFSEQQRAQNYLSKKMASNKNYIFEVNNKYEVIETVDPKWQGAIPLTILIDPDGKIVYKKEGLIEVLALRKAIVSKIGRVYP
jgi:peroxiredoxin